MLTERWKNGLRTLHGMHSRGFPNCFIMGTQQTHPSRESETIVSTHCFSSVRAPRSQTCPWM